MSKRRRYFGCLLTVVLPLAAMCLLTAAPAWALGRSYFTEDEIVALRESFRYRFEGALTFEYLTPNRVLGNWESGYLAFYGKVVPQLTLYAQATGFSRPRNELDPASRAFLGTVGAAINPTENLTINAAGSFGTNSLYLPRDRADLSLAIRIPVSENFTCAIDPGGYYSKYFPGDEAYGAFLGPSFFVYYWNFGYQFIYSRSTPKNLTALAQLVFFGYDVDGWHDTEVSVSFGDYNFLSNYLANPQQVRPEHYLDARINHRQWIGVDWGLVAEFGYFVLFKEISKWALTLGAFYEF
jgi:hypothetical protein